MITTPRTLPIDFDVYLRLLAIMIRQEFKFSKASTRLNTDRIATAHHRRFRQLIVRNEKLGCDARCITPILVESCGAPLWGGPALARFVADVRLLREQLEGLAITAGNVSKTRVRAWLTHSYQLLRKRKV